jgi:eukaryotic-like serine/threonine-protein kinase
LDPDRLLPPRQINSNISVRTEKAIQWAMSLHPADRPQTIEVFRESLLGNYQPVIRPMTARQNQSITRYLQEDPERTLLWVTAGLALISLLATFAR